MSRQPSCHLSRVMIRLQKSLIPVEPLKENLFDKWQKSCAILGEKSFALMIDRTNVHSF